MEPNFVCKHEGDQQNRTTAKQESEFLITGTITDEIGRRDVLLPVNITITISIKSKSFNSISKFKKYVE